ncbi:MAG: hypothetical protein HEQ26_15740 [Dolichospermum sp. DL01]|nr:MAG: hypothetical protein HEQ26_15740 [Dolichospermum sp. DL01]
MNFPIQEPPTQEPPTQWIPRSWRILLTIFTIGSTIGLGLGYGFKNATDSRICNPVATNTEEKSQTFNMVQFVMLKSGMNFYEVQSLLGGKATLVEMTGETATYIWKNCDDSSITVTFQKGKLIRTKQENLKI